MIVHHGLLASTLVLGATPFALVLVAWLWYKRTAANDREPPAQARKDRP